MVCGLASLRRVDAKSKLSLVFTRSPQVHGLEVVTSMHGAAERFLWKWLGSVIILYKLHRAVEQLSMCRRNSKYAQEILTTTVQVGLPKHT